MIISELLEIDPCSQVTTNELKKQNTVTNMSFKEIADTICSFAVTKQITTHGLSHWGTQNNISKRLF